MDILPQELIDSILDELASDAEALKSAALVCRAFYPRCQKLLFSSVTLEPKESSTHNPALSFRALLGSTTISRLVNSLTIYNFTRGRTSWFSQDRDVIPGILSTLPNLREVTLSGRHYDRRWDGSSDMNASLCASFSRPRVRSLTLVYMSFLQPSDFSLLLSNSPDLTNLRLLNVYISDQFTLQLPITEYEGAKRPKLKTLAIQNVPLGLLDILRSTVDLSALRKLQFWSDHGDQSGHLQRLLEAADELEDVVFHGLTSSTNGLDISHVPRIKCYFSNFHRVANEHSVLAGLTGLFFQRYAPATSRMRDVTFHVRSHPRAIINCPQREWRRLEDKMVGVEKVRFEIPVRDMRDVGDEERRCVEAVRVGMAKLNERGVLDVAMVEMVG